MEKEYAFKTKDFDDILNPDLTLEEKILYYEDLKEVANEKEEKQLEDEIAIIINNLLEEGDSFNEN